MYLYNGGYFSNIEIVYLEDKDEIDQLYSKYSGVGYPVRKKKFETIDILKKELIKVPKYIIALILIGQVSSLYVIKQMLVSLKSICSSGQILV